MLCSSAQIFDLSQRNRYKNMENSAYCVVPVSTKYLASSMEPPSGSLLSSVRHGSSIRPLEQGHGDKGKIKSTFLYLLILWVTILV